MLVLVSLNPSVDIKTDLGFGVLDFPLLRLIEMSCNLCIVVSSTLLLDLTATTNH